MLFLTYYELNENMSEKHRIEAAQRVMSSGHFPPGNVKVLQWFATPDAWGILLAEAQNAMDVMKALDVWRMAEGGFFRCTRTTSVVSVEDAMKRGEELLKAFA